MTSDIVGWEGASGWGLRDHENVEVGGVAESFSVDPCAFVWKRENRHVRRGEAEAQKTSDIYEWEGMRRRGSRTAATSYYQKDLLLISMGGQLSHAFMKLPRKMGNVCDFDGPEHRWVLTLRWAGGNNGAGGLTRHR
jgi:hypothetical protein